jgi:5-methylcytosine-specific restriction endonuclease McrA
MTNLAPQIEGLFCSEPCRQTAKVIRYWRRISRDGRIDRPDVKDALHMKVAHLLAGGYPEQIRRLSPATRKAVWDRDHGRCRLCGAPGNEIDHISDSSSALGNLQLLCTTCHQRKTRERMVPASAESKRRIEQWWRVRVAPEEPIYLCDDQQQWAVRQRQLRKERKEWLLIARLADLAPDFWTTSAALTGFSAEEAEGLLVSLAATVTGTTAVVSAPTQP